MLDLHKHWIAKLVGMIDPGRVARCRRAVRRALDFKPVEELPYLDLPPDDGGEAWPTYPYNDAFDDPEKMLVNQLGMVYDGLRADDYRPPNIRPHFGTVILPSVLGGPWQLTDNSLPWAHPLDGGSEAIRGLIDRGPGEPKAGLGGRCFDTAAYYRHALAEFGPLADLIDIYHPDLQGPYDVAHLLMGPDIFLAGYDEPELVERLVEVVTETYRRFIAAWADEVGFADADGLTTHWSFYIRGRIMLRNDTTILLRREHYRRFVQPFDARLLGEFGGAIHFCGKADHLFELMLETEGLGGLNSSQPELNDHQRLLRAAQERGVVLLGWPIDMLPDDVRTGVVVSRG